MTYRWPLFFLIIFSCITSYAAVQMQLEPSILHQGQTLQLTITLDDPHNQGVPDLALLRKNFAVVGTQRTANYSVINGQAHAFSQWIILLEPQKTGKITIPPIQVGAEKTPTAVVTVEAESIASDVSLPEEANTVQPGKAPIQLHTHLSTSNPYINQQVIYTVSLMNSRRLLDAEYTPPQVKDALVVTLGDPIRHQAIRDGIPYVVESLKYAIYPQKSGVLKITPPRFSALLFDTVPGKIQVQAKPAALNVQSIPATVRDKVRDWLPAEQVILREQYDHDNPDIEQGAMLVRNVTLEVHGLPAQMLPSLSFDKQKSFQLYLEKPQEETQIKKGQLVSVVHYKVSYLLNQKGDVTIPALCLAWFNVKTGKIEYAKLPQHSMTVHPSARGGSQIKQPLLHHSPLSVTGDVQKGQQVLVEKPMFGSKIVHARHRGWFFAGLFAILWIVTIILWWKSARRVKSAQSYRQLYKKIKRACHENDQKAVKENLLLWGQLVWPEASILSLSDLEKQIQEGDLKKAVQQLMAYLYKNHEDTWLGASLWQAWAAYSKSGKQRKKLSRVMTGSHLPPLYPPKGKF